MLYLAERVDLTDLAGRMDAAVEARGAGAKTKIDEAIAMSIIQHPNSLYGQYDTVGSNLCISRTLIAISPHHILVYVESQGPNEGDRRHASLIVISATSTLNPIVPSV